VDGSPLTAGKSSAPAYKITGGALRAPQDLKHSDLYLSHSAIASFFFASHSVLSFREQSMALPEHSISKQLRHGSPQPPGDNAIKTSVTITFRTRKREVKTTALLPSIQNTAIQLIVRALQTRGYKWNSIKADQVAPAASCDTTIDATAQSPGRENEAF
jgi:hypothetical protein